MNKNVGQSFTCLCGKTTSFISDGERKEPCPECGRIYRGKYDKKTFTIRAIDISPGAWSARHPKLETTIICVIAALLGMLVSNLI